MNRRNVITAIMGGALAATFTADASAQNNNGVLFGNPRIKGSFAGLTMQNTDVWPQHTLKLVYFGLPWATTGCSEEFLAMNALLRDVDPAGLRITLVIIHPEIAQPAGTLPPRYPVNSIVLSGSMQDVLKIAIAHGVSYIDTRVKSLATASTEPKYIDHTPRGAFLMRPDGINLLRMDYSKTIIYDLNAVANAVREQLRAHFPDYNPPSLAP